MKTRCEKLQEKMGQKVECESCHQRKQLTENWRLGFNLLLYCPKCQDKIQGVGLISI